MVKNSPAYAGAERDTGSIPGSGRSPGGRHGNTLQYSCLENPMDRGIWWAIVYRVAKSQTCLKQLSRQARATSCLSRNEGNSEENRDRREIQWCPPLCDPIDYTVHGILQARILEWVTFPFSKGSSQPRD